MFSKTTTTQSAPVPATPTTQPTIPVPTPRKGRQRVAHIPKQWSPQQTAASATTALGFDSRLPIAAMPLPGPKRAQEGRGGAMADIVMLRLLIRCPLLPAFTAAIPVRRGGRPTPVPDLYWVFYLTATRRYASSYHLDQELREHWSVIREEFWFEHGVLLPDAKPNGDVPDGDDFRKWRKRNILNPDKPGQLAKLARRLTQVSLPLALAIRTAERGDSPRRLLDAEIWDLLAVDATVLDAPSGVREVHVHDENGNVVGSHITGSRATVGRPRVHHAVEEKVNKPHGAENGLYNVVATTKGHDSYTRVVLGAEIGQLKEGEINAAMRLLRSIYTEVGLAFPVLVYDGAMTPVHYQDLMAEFGVYCVNAVYARNVGGLPEMRVDGDGQARTPLGRGTRLYGTKRGQDKRTWNTPLPSVPHETADGVHEHHLAADDGAVYELNRPKLAGGDVYKTGLLRPTLLERLKDNGEFYLRLTLTGQCSRGPYKVSYDLRKTDLNRKGHLPWKAIIANVRALPDALIDEYAAIFGQRNQIESFFSWLETCFYRKDRHASWGRDAQLLDMIGAGLLHNTLAWAHLAYRHPAQDTALRAALAGLPANDESEPAAAG